MSILANGTLKKCLSPSLGEGPPGKFDAIVQVQRAAPRPVPGERGIEWDLIDGADLLSGVLVLKNHDDDANAAGAVVRLTDYGLSELDPQSGAATFVVRDYEILVPASQAPKPSPGTRTRSPHPGLQGAVAAGAPNPYGGGGSGAGVPYPPGGPAGAGSAGSTPYGAPFGSGAPAGKESPPGPNSYGAVGGSGGAQAGPGAACAGAAPGCNPYAPVRGGAGGGGGGGGSGAGGPAGTVISDIKDLAVFTGPGWVVKAWVVQISPVKYFDRKDGSGEQGRLQNVVIRDGSDKLRCTLWAEAIDAFASVLQEGKTYTFAGGQLKPADQRYNPGAKVECSFGGHGVEILEVADDPTARTLTYNFVPLDQVLGKSRADPPITVGSLVDVAGWVQKVGEVINAKSRATEKEFRKLDIVLADEGGEVRMTMWNSFVDQHQEKLRVGAILLLKEVKVGEWQGQRNLSSQAASLVAVVGPKDHPRAAQLVEFLAK